MPRFVILEHDWPERHWDLMLEAGAVLRTWRLASPPEPGRSIAATAIGDHRLLYLDYEGPLSGNRGTVKRWDAGEFTWLTDAEGRVSVRLGGTRCCGTAMLVQREGNEWSFEF
jgi:hypothetical protein